MKKRWRSVIALALTTMLVLGGCSKPKEPTTSEESTKTDVAQTEVTEDEPDEPVPVQTSSGTITLAELKSQYGAGGGGDQFKPFYNVEQSTCFVFHFNAPVEPCDAITVHTDPKCEISSTVYQMNDGYMRDDGGMDVVVKPGRPVLNAQGHAGGELENYNWGYAPIYYLCLRYDRDATKATRLAQPVVIPFTVRSEVSIPNLSYDIDTTGVISLKWKPVENAVKYNIYEAYRVKESSAANGLTRAEAGYVGDHLHLLTTVNSTDVGVDGMFSFKDFHLDGTDNMLVDDRGYVIAQNFYELGSYYVTALDAMGNESFFSMAVSGWKYDDQLPNRFDAYESFVKDGNGNVTYLPESVPVTMRDKSVAYFPVNFTKGEAQYEGYRYEYEIPGTHLTGYITYKAPYENYPDRVVSSLSVPTGMYVPRNDIDIIPSNTVPTFTGEDYANTSVDLASVVTFDESRKIPYNYDARLRRADMESARVVLDGVYPEGSDPTSILTYREDGFVADESKGTGSTGTVPDPGTGSSTDSGFTPDPSSDGGTSESTDGGFSGQPDTGSTQESGTGESAEEEPEGDPLLPLIPGDSGDGSTDVASADSGQNVNPPSVDTGSDAEITSDNLVDEMQEAVEQEVAEADTQELPEVTYPLWADSAEEAYLGLMMMARQDIIDLSGFPSLQNPQYLIDVWEKTVYQNPYIISVRGIGYDPSTALMLCEYTFDATETARRQQEIYNKAAAVSETIFTDGMTDEDKNKAIWDYLEANTVYDHTALEAAEANGFSGEVGQMYPDSFNTYGILVNGKGVCQSYAYVYKLLASQAGLNCVMLTGYMNKTLPHAWNAVQLDGNWYWVDVTNNRTAVGIPYMIFQSPSTFAERCDYMVDESFDLDTNLAYVLSSDESKDYYTQHGLVAQNVSDAIQIAAREYGTVMPGEYVAVRCYEQPVFDETFMSELAVAMMGIGMQEQDLYRLRMGYMNSYFVLFEE